MSMVEGLKSPEVYMHVASFAPWCAFVGNRRLVEWTKKSGADKMEWIAAGPIVDFLPIGPTNEVLSQPIDKLRLIFQGKLGAGHVMLCPFASPWTIGRKIDPTNPGQRVAFFHTIFSTETVSSKALRKLEQVVDGSFPVNVFPPFRGRNLQEHYYHSRLQTHPENLDDKRDAEGLINAVWSNRYPDNFIRSICADLYHMQGATSDGLRPLGRTETELFKTLEKFVQADVLGEVHVQPGRLIYSDDNIESEKDLRVIFGENPSYETFTGRALRFLIHTLGFRGSFTIELDPRSLTKMFGKRILLPQNFSEILKAQAAVVDYIRRA